MIQEAPGEPRGPRRPTENLGGPRRAQEPPALQLPVAQFGAVKTLPCSTCRDGVFTFPRASVRPLSGPNCEDVLSEGFGTESDLELELVERLARFGCN